MIREPFGKIAIAFVLLLAVAGLTFRSTTAFRDSALWVGRTHDLIEKLLIAQDVLPDEAREQAALQSARRLMVDPALTQRLDQLLLAAPSSGGPQPRAGRRAALQSLISAERELLRARVAQTERDVSAVLEAQLIGTSVSMLLLLWAFLRLHGEIARRRQTEGHARQREQELATTLNSLREGVFTTDHRGLVTRMNHAAETLSEVPSAAALGKPLVEVCRLVEDGSRPLDPVGAVLSGLGGGPTVSGVRLHRARGPVLAVDVNCVVLQEHMGTPRGAVLVVRDISDAEQARLVQESARRQMALSERMAAVGLLAAGVAHEINNPLAYVTTNLEALILTGVPGSGPPEDWNQLVEDALLGADRMRRIVRSLKTFSRVSDDAGGLIDVVSVIELALEMTNSEIGQRARLVKRYGPTPRVLGDEARLGQVIINLIVNAVQALHSGGPRDHEISITTATTPQGWAVIAIRDTGQGIPPELIGRIFDPFFTTKPVGIGTGLGLSICHNIVSSMGGNIEVSSEASMGTTFRVLLPPAPSGRLVAEPSPAPQAGSIGVAKVMVIDDDPLVGRSLARVLSGYEVIVVTGAARALELLRDDVSLVLCDLMMPSMSGIEFHDELVRARPALASRVVFMTGGVFTTEARRFVEGLPAGRVVEKPMAAKEVLALAAQFSCRA